MIIAANFEKFLNSPSFLLNFIKSQRISKNQLKSSKTYGQKPFLGEGGPKDPQA